MMPLDRTLVSSKVISPLHISGFLFLRGASKTYHFTSIVLDKLKMKLQSWKDKLLLGMVDRVQVVNYVILSSIV